MASQSTQILTELQAKHQELLSKRKEIVKNLKNIGIESIHLGLKKAKNYRYHKKDKELLHDKEGFNEKDDIEEDQFKSDKKRKMNNNGNDDINMLSSGKKISSSTVIGDISNKDYDDNKNRKISSGIVIERKIVPTEETNKPHFQIEKPQMKELPPEMKKRDSKMMGNLLGHLKKAQSVLQSQSELLKKQQEVVHKVEEKVHKESDLLKEEHAKTIEAKKKELLEEKIALEREILKIDHDRLYKYAEDHLTRISNFILTKEKPQILWLPNKPKESTNELISETKVAFNNTITQMINRSDSTFKALMTEFEEGLKRRDNNNLKEIEKEVRDDQIEYSRDKRNRRDDSDHSDNERNIIPDN